MRKIKLSQGRYAIIDNEDFDRVNQYNEKLQNRPNSTLSISK